jgi:hypothetical protein
MSSRRPTAQQVIIIAVLIVVYKVLVGLFLYILYGVSAAFYFLSSRRRLPHPESLTEIVIIIVVFKL